MPIAGSSAYGIYLPKTEKFLPEKPGSRFHQAGRKPLTPLPSAVRRPSPSLRHGSVRRRHCLLDLPQQLRVPDRDRELPYQFLDISDDTVDGVGNALWTIRKTVFSSMGAIASCVTLEQNSIPTLFRLSYSSTRLLIAAMTPPSSSCGGRDPRRAVVPRHGPREPTVFPDQESRRLPGVFLPSCIGTPRTASSRQPVAGQARRGSRS